MKTYQDLISKVMSEGVWSNNRTGIKTISVFGTQSRYDLRKGFPATTTKRLAWKPMVGELLWFLEGGTNERRLAELTYGKPRDELKDKTTIWTANADAQGVALGYRNNDLEKNLGPVYGSQWRDWNGESLVDQIQNVVNRIKTNPDCRRIILTAWNPGKINEMALPPCHCFAQFRVINGELHCNMYQRSADIGLGVPFNIASYSLLVHLIARECGLGVGEFVHTIGDAHIYENHIEPLTQLLKHDPFALPTLEIDDDFTLAPVLNPDHKARPYSHNDTIFPLDSVNKIRLVGYECYPTLKMEMAV